MHNLIPSLPECKPVGRSGPENGDIATVPVGLDPEHHRIILAHWYGWRPVGVVAAEIVADLTFRRKVQRLCAKGPRAVGELLGELGAERCLMSVIEAKLNRFLTVPDEALDATSGHDFPPRPLHEVRQ